ncbi:MAG TPA: histidine kinase [Steroidobacteraceae bacterium]|nr:histidine kinase [Steroidobacteraceae bacterium]
MQIIGWSLFFYGQASGEVIFASVPWSKAATLWGGICLAGIGLTHLLRWVAKRHAWLALPPAPLLTRILAGVLLVSLTYYFITIALSLTVYGTPVAPILGAFYRKLVPGAQLFNQFINSLAVNLMWVAIYFGFVMQRHRYRAELRQAQLNEALQAAELRLLKSQLNPHFLFNALNGVRALIADEPGHAQDAVTQLARTLRYTLAAGDEDLVTMARELEMVDDYLALESLRLAERLHVVREIDSAASTVRIPVMLLQTLVENAVKHGIAPLRRGGALRIAARVVESELIIQVVNPRPIDATADRATEGVGLKNSSERLRLLFGPAARLHLDLSVAGQAIAEVRLPV